jgi:glycosyltransferase involved in cell wall biosynthesis
MTKGIPVVSVNMPVYNTSEFLREAIESILNQTFADFEFIIVNDCSTDNSREIISSYKDSRIKYIENPVNLGVAETRNIAIKNSAGKYIAIMDSDDVSLPVRLEKQVAFLESHPDIGLCGSYMKTTGNIHDIVCKTPLKHNDIRAALLFRPGIWNGTVFMRRDLIIRHKIFLDKNFKAAEDYLFLSNLIEDTKFANLPEVLGLYRINESSISHVLKNELMDKSNSIRIKQLLKILPEASEEEIKLHLQISSNLLSTINLKQNLFKKTDLDLSKVLGWFNKLIKNNRDNKKIDDKALRRLLSQEWIYICGNNIAPFTWLKSIFSALFRRDTICFSYSIWFMIKTILRYINVVLNSR